MTDSKFVPVATVATLGVVGAMFAWITVGPRINPPKDLIESFWPSKRDK